MQSKVLKKIRKEGSLSVREVFVSVKIPISINNLYMISPNEYKSRFINAVTQHFLFLKKRYGHGENEDVELENSKPDGSCPK